jgi:AraC-like DNA-binding protein
MRRLTRDNPVFPRVFISYFIILILPLTAMAATSANSFRAARGMAVAANHATLERVVNAIEREMADLRQQLALFSSLQATGEYLYPSESGANQLSAVRRGIAVKAGIREFEARFPSVDRLCIFSKKLDRVVSRSGWTSLSQYYDAYWSGSGITLDELQSRMNTTQDFWLSPMLVYADAEQRMLMIQPLPVMGASLMSGVSGALVAVIKPQLFTMALTEIETTREQSGAEPRIRVSVTDGAGGHVVGIDSQDSGAWTLTASPIPVTRGDITASARSRLTGWLYTARMDERAALARLYAARSYTIILSVIVFIAGLVMVWANASRSARPLARLARSLVGTDSAARFPRGNVFEVIALEVERLITDNRRMSSQIDASRASEAYSFIGQALANLICFGREQAARALLSEVFRPAAGEAEPGAAKWDLDDSARRHLVEALLSVIERLGMDAQTKRNLVDYIQPLTGKAFEEAVYELAGSLRDRVSAGAAAGRLEEQGKKVFAYIDENLGDPQLNAAMVCERFKLSRYQLNKVCAWHTRVDGGDGLSFAAALEQARLEQSLVMLRESSASVSEIAARVGYTSDQSYRRAFKRVYGESPGEARSARTD